MSVGKGTAAFRRSRWIPVATYVPVMVSSSRDGGQLGFVIGLVASQDVVFPSALSSPSVWYRGRFSVEIVQSAMVMSSPYRKSLRVA